jgi:endo-1,4-beta-D-glucanase Y
MLATVLGAVAAVLVVAHDAGGRSPADEARAAARHFLEIYVRPDGRVVRIDQGGDTVSEGQAYGMLLAAGIGDRGRFDSIWTWTRSHLQRPDHLLSWRWVEGAVADPSPAADADLLAAGALALAGRRFSDHSLVVAADRLGGAILARETATFGSWQVLMAGPWARSERVVNPSYFAIGMMSTLYDITGEQRWRPVAATSRRMLDRLTSSAPSLVPDWATVAADGGDASPRPAPGGSTVLSGYEADRAYVQLAVDCDRSGPPIAARAWPFFAVEAAGTIHAAYRLDGSPATAATHPLALVAAAASAAAAGDAGASDHLLDRASALGARYPTYYGAAWIAIGRLWLDTKALGGCRP